MIHAKELRYGNKVQTYQGEVITVQQIHSQTLIYDTQIKVSREVANARGGGSRSSHMTQVVEIFKEADLQEINPITLTPKILERHGFRNYVREQWILKIGNSNIDFEFDGDGLRLRESIPSRISIKYLHQLQNFLYAVVGHELEEVE
jgi:hypothetical protein